MTRYWKVRNQINTIERLIRIKLKYGVNDRNQIRFFYYIKFQFMAPIGFWCRRKLNPKSLIQLSKTLPVKLIRTHYIQLLYSAITFISWLTLVLISISIEITFIALLFCVMGTTFRLFPLTYVVVTLYYHIAIDVASVVIMANTFNKTPTNSEL